MKLVKFSVTNFRSILEAQNIPISDITVLVGKNNEGKSNLLKALSIAMEIISYHARRYGMHRIGRSNLYRTPSFFGAQESGTQYPLAYGADDIYKWERDFPISKIPEEGIRQTILKLEFELDNKEIKVFNEKNNVILDDFLSLKITITSENYYLIEAVQGDNTLNLDASIITNFITERISFNYIPAVRTHEKISQVIDKLVSHELLSLRKDRNYINALKTIDELEEPILKSLSERIKEPLSEFLPEITGVKINPTESSRDIERRRNFDVEIDDGTLTSIKQKGDGIQSLAALGLLKNKSRRLGAAIIAIEEPESHLHSGAIHRLQKMIESLGSNNQGNQIVLATHNPLFVNKYSIESNIIIDCGKAEPAKDIETIRDTLGVQVSDNLTNTRYALVVEGAEDKRSLEAILPTLSSKIKTALKNNELAIYPIGGAGNLSYYLSILKVQMCIYHVFLDKDNSANKERDKAEEKNMLDSKNLTQATCRGMSKSEFEDCINSDIYKKEVLKKHGVDLNVKEFRTNKRKWSDRISDCFNDQGKPFNDNKKQAVKNTVVSCIEKNPSKALCEHKGNSIKALAKALEVLLETR